MTESAKHALKGVRHPTWQMIAPMLIMCAATASGVYAVSSGWDNGTCNATETYNGDECSLVWCVNQNFAYYNCDGLSTAKYSCSDGCKEPDET